MNLVPQAENSEELLSGGNISGPVVRIGQGVHKPSTPATVHITAFLTHLHAQGLPVPQPLGSDAQGRQVLEFIPGLLAMETEPLSLDQLHHLGSLIRQIHHVSSQVPIPEHVRWDSAIEAPGKELLCHNDLAPWNLIITDTDQLVFIDWDATGPSTPVWDLAYALQTFTLNDPTQDPEDSAERMMAMVTGYEADKTLRQALPKALCDRPAAMRDHLVASYAQGVEPWASMYIQGHGKHWATLTKWVKEHQNVWERVLIGEGRF